MASDFPGSVDSFSAKSDGPGNFIMAAHVNDLQDSVVATQEYLLEVADVNSKVGVNLLADTLTHEASWLAGTTFNDYNSDTYGPSLWNLLANLNSPDVTGEAGGSTDNFTRCFRATFDANGHQSGMVQFLTAQQTRPLRGQAVSLSADLWGTNVSNLRMAVVVWTSTADSLTSAIVGTWGANPTLATNWAYIGTPASIAISGTQTRYSVENLTIPTNANNIGVFIWTPDSENSGDLWNVARVKLEPGAQATAFVARDPAEELFKIGNFLQKVDPTSNTATVGTGIKSSTTNIVVYTKLDYPMRVAPSLVHNVTGYTNGAPGTTTVALSNLTAGGFFSITGALTLTGPAATKGFMTLLLAAGTSWNGTQGDQASFRVGPDVVMLFDSRL